MSESDVPTYSMAECDRRWELARDFMGRTGLDALLVFGEHEDEGSAPVSHPRRDETVFSGAPGLQGQRRDPPSEG